ncbi:MULTISPECIES: zinc ribbon domain-containing protein [unclassified Streptomyces]|uniref:zinc ribbon domain-containing protein n=1 Tax=unclassified Streptomyces TaxID=2593676 RepID=UPI002E307884|nr:MULTISPECIES: zinc-ribbon domain-containing protein [unclassified Streptomyces]WUC68443.1 zinc ribbon domain-containing protein [Streptomyces sp. NBC_00539]
MRACPVCGASNEPTDDFCGNCGSYLGWSDAAATRETPPPQPGRATPATADPAPPSTGSAPAGSTSAGSTSAGSAPTGSASITEPADGASNAPAPPDSPAPPRRTTPPADPAPPAGSGPAAVPPAGRAAADPVPVRPARAVAPRPVVNAPSVGEDVSGVPCPSCGTPNPPDRRFCRRCATPLTPRTVAPALPWWRTIWPLRRRTRAGSGRLVRFLVILAAVLALCAGGFLLLPAGRQLIEDTRDKLGKSKAVTPTRVEATAELPGHPPASTTDGLSNRYWGAPGPGASVTYTFAKPFRLVGVIVTNGASPSPEEYARQGRALQIEMEVTARDGAKHHKSLTLSDKPGPQTFPTGINDATSIRLTLDAPAGLDQGRHLALAEVEFFQRS